MGNIVFVFFLSHTEFAEFAELPVLESSVHAALESADFVAGFATTAMRGVPLTAHPLHAHRLSFLISAFSFIRSHRASRRDVVCDKFCAFHLFLQHLRCKYIDYSAYSANFA